MKTHNKKPDEKTYEMDCQCEWDGSYWRTCGHSYIDHGTVGTYRIRGSCYNCGANVICTFTKGHDVDSKFPPCAVCGCGINLRARPYSVEGAK